MSDFDKQRNKTFPHFDPDLLEESPSGGYRAVRAVMLGATGGNADE